LLDWKETIKINHDICDDSVNKRWNRGKEWDFVKVHEDKLKILLIIFD